LTDETSSWLVAGLCGCSSFLFLLLVELSDGDSSMRSTCPHGSRTGWRGKPVVDSNCGRGGNYEFMIEHLVPPESSVFDLAALTNMSTSTSRCQKRLSTRYHLSGTGMLTSILALQKNFNRGRLCHEIRGVERLSHAWPNAFHHNITSRFD
jgi:hypothetical protein